MPIKSIYKIVSFENFMQETAQQPTNSMNSTKESGNK